MKKAEDEKESKHSRNSFMKKTEGPGTEMQKKRERERERERFNMSPESESGSRSVMSNSLHPMNYMAMEVSRSEYWSG